MDTAAAPVTAASKGKKTAWPGTMAEQVQAVRNILAALTAPLTPDDAARHYARAGRARVAEILETLAALGKAREVEDGKYIGR